MRLDEGSDWEDLLGIIILIIIIVLSQLLAYTTSH